MTANSPDSILAIVPEFHIAQVLPNVHRAGLGQRARLISADLVSIPGQLTRAGVPDQLQDHIAGNLTDCAILLLHVPNLISAAQAVLDMTPAVRTFGYSSTQTSSAVLALAHIPASIDGEFGDDAGSH